MASELVTPAPGSLYVVATPLGNLGDLTQRAADTLRAVAVVAAEDTRRTRGLLSHLDAHPRLLSFHAHSDRGRVDEVIAILRGGEDVALVTDAGTPGVSDPGPLLVDAVRAAGLPVVPIPGASAVTTALSVSGFPADRYAFLGFPPRKGAERERWLGSAARSADTIVCYEAANRLAELLADLGRTAGSGRRALVARELTKLHEELRAGSLADLAAYYADHEPKGEVTLVLAGAPDSVPVVDPELVRTAARELVGAGRTTKDVVAELVARFGLPRNDVYRLVMELSRES
ncbi:MAG TPA: 16S rRNA (cytidine(1402)-2'-O)-methyltransferase [Gemmatimonadales bacterium]|nr:16S rRNA (cytidine(1402)-2'-O)-methyltransferase [Gemmatimonadales bacterium]